MTTPARAQELYAAGRYDEAIAEVRALLERTPGDGSLLRLLAACQLAKLRGEGNVPWLR